MTLLKSRLRKQLPPGDTQTRYYLVCTKKPPGEVSTIDDYHVVRDEEWRENDGWYWNTFTDARDEIERLRAYGMFVDNVLEIHTGGMALLSAYGDFKDTRGQELKAQRAAYKDQFGSW